MHLHLVGSRRLRAVAHFKNFVLETGIRYLYTFLRVVFQHELVPFR